MELQPVDRFLAALADPGRRLMVEHLARGPATVKALAAPVGMRLPSALKHLRVLEEGGIVVSEKAGRARTYRMAPAAFSPLTDWVRRREEAMNAAFDRLGTLIAETPEATS